MQIADKYDGIIINADALQVYDCWRILTARPSALDEATHPHFLYGHVDKAASYSVGTWLRDLRKILTDTEKMPIIVGGTGLYFSTLTNGLVDIPDVENSVREAAEQMFKSGGLELLLKDLSAHDPQTLQGIDQQNPARVMRAWEVWKSTGRGLADWQKDTPAPLLPLEKVNAFVLNAPKEYLTPRINLRFRQMLSLGALDECHANLPDWDATRLSSRAIGAPELIAHLRGETTLETAIALSEIATRQYAKRQRSWFRSRMKGWTWIDPAT